MTERNVIMEDCADVQFSEMSGNVMTLAKACCGKITRVCGK